MTDAQSEARLGEPHLSQSRIALTPRLTTLGKYRLIAEIGHGGMAEVFLSVMEGPGNFSKLIALKVLRQQFAEDAEGREMFLNEARLAARLNHPNIVQTYEVGDTSGRHFIAMEYLEGQPYSRVLHRSRTERDARSPLSTAMTLRILAETLAGLQYAHDLKDFDGTSLSLVHRDVSPHNVFITYDGTVKLLDFGIAKAVGGSATTRTGVLKGKVGYMAPEQVFDEEVDRRADVYAVGVMMWEALASRRLWQGTSDVAILTKVANEAVPLIDSVVASLPAELSRICMKAVARKRDDRFASAAEFQNALETYLDASTERAAPRDIGKFVSERFDDVRSTTRQLIETQLSKARSVGANVPIEPVLLPAVTGSNPVARRSDLGNPTSSSSPSVSVSMPSPLTTDGEASSNRNRFLIVGGATLALAAIAWFGFANRRGDSTEAAVPTASATTSAALAPTTGSAAATTIQITLIGEPANAKLFFDEEPLASNPIVRDVPKDFTEHTLSAVAPGYEDDSVKLMSNGNKTVIVRLKKQAPKTPSGAVAGYVRPGAKPKETAQAVQTAAPPPVAPPPAAPTTAKNTPKIDVDNPFDKK